MADRFELALQLAEETISGLELETLSVSSAALRCLRLARLLSDEEAIEWLIYETSGYPKISENTLDSRVFSLACRYGREMKDKDGKSTVFSDMADELEVRISANQAALGSMTTQGTSFSGEWAHLAVEKMSGSVAVQNGVLIRVISETRHKLSVLRGQYYAYALSVYLELAFSKQAEDVFRTYRLNVDRSLLGLAPKSLEKLAAAYERLTSDDAESWSQALASCRRVYQELADALYKKVFDSVASPYVTKSGKQLDVTGDKYRNRLSAVIDHLSQSNTTRMMIDAHVVYVVEWAEYLHDLLNKGVHDLQEPLSFEVARAAVLHTYVLFGDIATLLPGADATPSSDATEQ